jgi:DNA-binding GntR family transcriptional regulator
LEPELAAQAAINASDADINDLEAIDLELDKAIAKGDVPAYLKKNYAFHAKLYAMAQSPILTEIADGLWLRFGPSLRGVCGRLGTQNLPDQHKEALTALRARDAIRTASAIRDDVVQGMEQVRRALEKSSSLTD